LQGELDLLRSRAADLETRQERVKEELRTMQENQSTLQRIDFYAKDVVRQEDKIKKLTTKRTSQLIQLFARVPDVKSLRVEFRQGQEAVERRLKAAEAEQHRLRSEIGVRRSARSELKRELERKSARAGALEDRVREVLVEGASLPAELATLKDQLDLARRELQVPCVIW
jgi:chromosome segregation ATPase